MARIRTQLKMMWRDHDGINITVSPPVKNQWYTMLNAMNVRLLWCVIQQGNGEAAAKTVEVRWTIDGTVYFGGSLLANATPNWINRNRYASGGGTDGLALSATDHLAAFYAPKMGQNFLIEMRLTDNAGTAQTLNAKIVYETLEVSPY